jgi:hypothetical protein
MPHQYKEQHIDFYNSHNSGVLEFFRERAPTRILHVCWEAGDGWDALCRFLDCGIPAQNFPHLNRDPQHRSDGNPDIHPDQP